MALLTIAQACAIAHTAGFTGDSADVIVAIAAAESNLNTLAHGPANSDGSRDRGILQINDRAWADVPDSCCYDPQCSFSVAYQRISSHGNNFSPWTTYTSGAYRDHYQRGMCLGALSTGGGLGTGTSSQPTGVEATRRALVPAYTAMISGWGDPRPDVAGGAHMGEDLAAPRGSAANAPEPGVIVNNYVDTLGGNALVLSGSSGLYWYYAHLDAPSPIATGTQVQGGQQLGQVGNTGDAASTVPHLHYQVGPGGRWADPRIVLANFTPTPGGAAGQPPPFMGTGGGIVGTFGAKIHNTLVQTPGFVGIVLAIDEAEQFPGIVIFHPTSIADMPGTFLRSAMATVSGNALAFFVRGVTILTGFILLIALLWKAAGPQAAALLAEVA